MKESIAKKYIKELGENISISHNIILDNDYELYAGIAFTKTGVDGDLSVTIGSKMRTNGHFWYKQVSDIDFLKCICSIYHEEKHIMQNTQDYYEICPSDETIQMCIRQFINGNNRKYYTGKERYCNDLSEIDAEAYGLLNTYEFLVDNLPDLDANQMICDLVNEKIKTSDYFISGHYNNINDILDAFSEHYEEAKTAPVSYPVFAFYKNEDECIRFLQWCAKDREQNQPLIDKFNETTDPHEKDLLIASITHHLHPEIPYERIYPCLRDMELAPEEIFGRSLPDPSEDLIDLIDTDRIKNRIRIADEIHKSILYQTYNERNYQGETEGAALDEALELKKENNDEYSL